jgi:hypothetical protein
MAAMVSFLVLEALLQFRQHYYELEAAASALQLHP